MRKTIGSDVSGSVPEHCQHAIFYQVSKLAHIKISRGESEKGLSVYKHEPIYEYVNIAP